MKTTSINRLWIVAVALGWSFDFLFWKKAPGVNFALFAALCLLGGFYLLIADGLPPARKSLWLILFFVFFAAISFSRAESMTSFLAVGFTLFSMALLALTYRGGNWIKYTLTDYIGRFLSLLGSVIARPILFSAEARKARLESGTAPSKPNIWAVARGAIIALPILALFASLLASADVVFGQKLDDFIKLFSLEKFPEYIFRLVYILLIGYALAGVFLHSALHSNDEKTGAEGQPIIAPFFGFIEASIVLGSVAILFAAFVVVQFQYFFGGQSNIHIDGYTYSEYAVRGFGELVTVAFFYLLLFLGLSAVTRRETETQRKIFSGLGVALAALVLIMLVSAYQRLVMYETAYGFSRLRTYTHVFLVWIGLLLVATIVLEILRMERAFAFAAVIASFGFAASLSLLNVDAFIVERNIQRAVNVGQNALAQEGAPLDAQYFLDLSDDAVPALVEAYHSPALPDAVKEKVGAALACIRYRREQAVHPYPWQSFHLSRWYADRSLNSMKKELDLYMIKDADGPALAVSPAGEEFSCSSYPYFD